MKLNTFLMAALLSLSFATVAIAETVADSTINTAVTAKLSTKKKLSGSSISSATMHGTVSLSGNVQSKTQLNTATELVQSVDGVVDVKTNNVTVNGSVHPVDDALITAKIKGLYIQQKLVAHKDIRAMSIHVETNNGLVSLSG
jgi:osmotically-inducible protein OsmY